MIREGDRRLSLFTGKVYEVKSIEDGSVVLESLDGSSQVLTEEDNLELFYVPVENGEDSERLALWSLCPIHENDPGDEALTKDRKANSNNLNFRLF